MNEKAKQAMDFLRALCTFMSVQCVFMCLWWEKEESFGFFSESELVFFFFKEGLQHRV